MYLDALELLSSHNLAVGHQLAYGHTIALGNGLVKLVELFTMHCH